MSTRTFQLYLLWFRFLRVVRASARTFIGESRELQRRLPGMLRWLRALWLMPLWISFELYILAWERLEQYALTKYHHRLHWWQRGIFCLALSLTAWHVFVLQVTGWSLSERTVWISLVHGFALFLLWKRGARALRQVLGVRPVRPTDTRNPYAGLDLGN